MCLGIPGKITEITDNDPLTRSGLVDFSGVSRNVNLSLVEEAGVNDYVIVHAGFAISQIEEEEAQEIFKYLKEIDEAGA